MIYKKSSSTIFSQLKIIELGESDGVSQPPSQVLIQSVVPNLKTQVMKATGVIPKTQAYSTITITYRS